MMKDKSITLTEQGIDKAERMFKIDNLFDVKNKLNASYQHCIKNDRTMFKDKDYVVEDGEIMIVVYWSYNARPCFSDGSSSY